MRFIQRENICLNSSLPNVTPPGAEPDLTPGVRSPFISSNRREVMPAEFMSLRVMDGRTYAIDHEWRIWTRPLHLAPLTRKDPAVDETQRELRLIFDPKKPSCQPLANKLQLNVQGRPPPFSLAVVDTISTMNNCKVWRMPLAVPDLC